MKLPVNQMEILRNWLWEKRQKLMAEEAELTNKIAAISVERAAVEKYHEELEDDIEEELERSPCK